MDDRGRSLDFPRNPAPARPRSPAPGIPLFDLYGEARPRSRLDPVHVEPLVTRSARHDWTIRPHRHRDLHQVFWVREGGGTLLGEGPERGFGAPVLHLVPAGRVHGFQYNPASAGHVLTLTGAFLGACEGMLGEAHAADGIRSLALLPGDPLVGRLNVVFDGLETAFRELGPERNAVLAGHALLLLGLLRRGMEDAAEPRAERLQAALVRRFRESAERHLCEHEGLEAHCARLGVTQTTLTRACRAVTGRSPLGLIHERLMAEARRMLIHGSRSVSDVAYELGFEPAYFSRFFARHEGVPPAAYKRRNAA